MRRELIVLLYDRVGQEVSGGLGLGPLSSQPLCEAMKSIALDTNGAKRYYLS